MDWLKSLSQTKQALLLAVYVGGLLNFTVILQRVSGDSLIISLPQLLVITLEVIITISFSFFLFRLMSILGKWLYRTLATALTLISVIASYYVATFKVVIGYGIVASVLTTQDMDLFAEVIGWRFILWLFIGSFIPLILIWYGKCHGTINQQLCHWRSASYAIISVILSGLLVWVPVKQLDRIQKQNQKTYSVDLPSYSGTLAHSYLPINWLSALGLYLYTSFGNSENYQNLPSPTEKFNFIANQPLEDVYVIFIIGETTRGDHIGMLGYERDTTPLLAQEPNLIAFQGRSCDTATKLSLRCMFVKEGDVADDPQRTLKAKNVFSVLKELGFSSELFALQGEVWFYSMLGTDNYEFREMISAEDKNIGKRIDDMILVDKVKSSVQKYPEGKHLIILHTKGSHYQYSARYPREFAKYQDECLSINNGCSKEQYINSFDNSILYTDYFIKNVIDQVRDKKSIVFYASDHGESISDNQHLHGTPREIAPAEQFNVPLMVWMSDALIQHDDNKILFDNLQQKSKQKQIRRHEEIFDSILGCLGYTAADNGINPANNWCTITVEGAASL